MILTYTWLSGAIGATVTLLWLIGRPSVARLRAERRKASNYTGRHRSGLSPSVLSHWQADFEARVAAHLAERKALTAALKEPTQEMLLAAVDSDVPRFRHAAGAGRYAHLRDDELDAALRWDELLADKGLGRSPWNTPELLDEWVAEHEAAQVLARVGAL